MGNQFLRKTIQGGLLVASVATMAFAFNNCGKVPTAQFDPAQLESYDNKVSNLSSRYQGALDQDFCVNAKNYSCVHKVFSPRIDSADLGLSNDCVQLPSGGEICPVVHHLSYNSQAAQESCKENCIENYDFQDFDCHLKLGPSAEGVYPLVVTDSDLTDAISTLHSSCEQIQQGITK